VEAVRASGSAGRPGSSGQWRSRSSGCPTGGGGGGAGWRPWASWVRRQLPVEAGVAAASGEPGAVVALEQGGRGQAAAGFYTAG
jgi:sirohydrochlorin ferrochelatase